MPVEQSQAETNLHWVGKKSVAWKRIDELRKFGGIRIEDDLVVTRDGAENLTRESWSQSSSVS